MLFLVSGGSAKEAPTEDIVRGPGGRQSDLAGVVCNNAGQIWGIRAVRHWGNHGQGVSVLSVSDAGMAILDTADRETRGKLEDLIQGSPLG